MDFILDGVSSVINAMAAVLGGFSFTRNLGEDMGKIMPYLQKANSLLPVSDALAVLGLFITVNLALMAYYWITRSINLIRGAG